MFTNQLTALIIIKEVNVNFNYFYSIKPYACSNTIINFYDVVNCFQITNLSRLLVNKMY